MASAHSSKRRSLLFLLVVVLCLVGIPLLILTLSPALLVYPLANYFLNQSAMEILELNGLSLSSNSSSADLIILQQGANRYKLHDLSIAYSIGGLIDAQLKSIAIGKVEITQSDLSSAVRQNIDVKTDQSAEEASTNSNSLQDWLEIARQFPVERLTVNALVIDNTTMANDVLLTVNSEIAALQLDYRSLHFALQLDWSNQQSLSGQLLGSYKDGDLNRHDLFTSALQIQLAEQSLSWQSQTELMANSVAELPQLAVVFEQIDIEYDSMTLTTDAEFSNPLSAFAIPRFDLRLTSPQAVEVSLAASESQLLPARLADLQARFSLPLDVYTSWAGADEAITFRVSDVPLSLSSNSDTLNFAAELALAGLVGECTLALSCHADAQIAAQTAPVNYQQYRLEQANFLAPLRADYENQLFKLTLEQPTELSFNDFSATDLPLTAKSLEIDWNQEFSLHYSIASGQLELHSPVIGITLNDLVSDYFQAQASFELTNVQLSIAEQTSGGFSFVSKTLNPGFTDVVFVEPSIKGNLAFVQDALHLQMELFLKRQQLLSLAAQHKLPSNSGEADIRITDFLFSNITPFSGFFAQLPVNLDLQAGSVSAQSHLDWSIATDQSLELTGPVSISLAEIGGYYDNIAFVGLNTQLNALVESPTAIVSSEKNHLTLDTLDIGSRVSNINVDFEFDSMEQQLILGNFNAEAFGGSANFDEFNYKAGRENNTLVLNIEKLEIAKLIALADYPGVQADGAISGTLPVNLGASGISMENGYIGAVPPGGTIHYTPAKANSESTNPGIKVVNDALSNFHFEALESDAIYDENGDLVLAISLKGENPDMNNGQPINLNVNITDNIPTLLRSLQASRVITDILEEHLKSK